jgi:hypothetical protein
LGDSKELKELAHTLSLGLKTGRGEKERGDTGNGETLWEERGENLPKGKGLKPGADVAKGKGATAAAPVWGCWCRVGYAKVGRNGGGAIFCNRETVGLVGGGPGSLSPEEDDDDDGDGDEEEEEVPVNCCTKDLKSLGSVL